MGNNWADFEQTKKSYELYARFVVPHFRKSNVNREYSLQLFRDTEEELKMAQQVTIERAFEKFNSDRESKGNPPSICRGSDPAGAPKEKAMPAALSDDPRSETNPLFNQNTLRLGAFAFNGEGAIMTTVPEHFQLTWENTLDVAMQADAGGFEAVVPYARWRSLVDARHYTGRVYETLTWASAIAAKTSYSAIMSTCHVPLIHPIWAAKSMTTIDHVSRGRFALNIVCGWFSPEIEMFNAPLFSHDERYDYADEWISIVKQLWTNDEMFDFSGKYLNVNGAMSLPKPIQKPHPALMNAGGSGAGSQDYVAKHCDIAFTALKSRDEDELKAQIKALRKLAYEQHGRQIQVWCTGYVVQRNSYDEAIKYVDYYAEQNADEAGVDAYIREVSANTMRFTPEQLQARRHDIKAGKAGVPLLGSAEDITDQFLRVSKCGIDGILLLWVDYQDGIRRFNRHVMPMLEQAGLRQHRRALTQAVA